MTTQDSCWYSAHIFNSCKKLGVELFFCQCLVWFQFVGMTPRYFQLLFYLFQRSLNIGVHYSCFLVHFHILTCLSYWQLPILYVEKLYHTHLRVISENNQSWKDVPHICYLEIVCHTFYCLLIVCMLQLYPSQWLIP